VARFGAPAVGDADGVRRIVFLLTALPLLAACGGNSRTAAPPTTTVLVTPAAHASDLQTDFERVTRQVLPLVVQIKTASGLGSGVVFDRKGDVVTNAHVVGSASVVTVQTSTGRIYPRAKVVGTFPEDDLAVVRVSGTPPAATFADSSKLKVGEIVLAVGNPLGLQSSVTEGIISALGRTSTEETGATLVGLIQTSASINPGNSGGALVNLDGQVVGIPTLAAGSPFGGAAPGIGFAIPSNTVTNIAGQLAASGRVTRTGRPFLGIQAASLQTGDGVLVTKVYPQTGAARAGIQQGDVIVAVAGTPTASLEALSETLARYKPGDTVKVRLAGAHPRTVTVKLGELPG
jgi:putative serine protease PepD